MGRFKTWYEEGEGSVPEKLSTMFRRLSRLATDPTWRGCGFARIAAELAGAPGHPALAVVARHKASFEAWLEELLREGGIEEPTAHARQIMVLFDGTVTDLLIHRDPSYAEAGAAAVLHVLARPTR